MKTCARMRPWVASTGPRQSSPPYPPHPKQHPSTYPPPHGISQGPHLLTMTALVKSASNWLLTSAYASSEIIRRRLRRRGIFPPRPKTIPRRRPIHSAGGPPLPRELQAYVASLSPIEPGHSAAERSSSEAFLGFLPTGCGGRTGPLQGLGLVTECYLDAGQPSGAATSGPGVVWVLAPTRGRGICRSSNRCLSRTELECWECRDGVAIAL